MATSSSRRPRWLNRKLRDRSRSTSCSAFHDGSASSGASNSFSIHAEYRFSVARFQRIAQRPHASRRRARPRRRAVAHGDFARDRATSAGARSRVSCARHVPAVGDATSANQKYGGPPWRSRDLAATLPSGAISDSSPSTGFSAVNDDAQRRAAPRRDRRRQDREVRRRGRLAFGPRAAVEKSKTKNAPAISNNAVAAAANWRARFN